MNILAVDTAGKTAGVACRTTACCTRYIWTAA